MQSLYKRSVKKVINTSNNLSGHWKYIGQDCKPGSVSDDHLSWPDVATRLMRPTSRTATGRRFPCPIWSCSGWGLHGRYVTIFPCELLPHNFNLATAWPVSAVCFCCTFPIVTYAGRYPASMPCGARTFLIHPEDARDHLSYPKYDFNIYNT